MEKTKLVELKLSLKPDTSIRVSAYPTSLPKRFIDLPKKIHELIQYTLPITQNMHASCKSMRTLYKTPISFLQDFYDATDIELKKETDPYATNSYRITFKVFENSVFEHHFNLPILSNEETLTLFKQEIDSVFTECYCIRRIFDALTHLKCNNITIQELHDKSFSLTFNCPTNKNKTFYFKNKSQHSFLKLIKNISQDPDISCSKYKI